MKKAFKLIAAAAALFAAASCQKELPADNTSSAVSGEARTYEAVFEEDTKMTANVSVDGSKIATKWDGGEMIFIADDLCTDANCPILMVEGSSPSGTSNAAWLSGSGSNVSIRYTPNSGASKVYAACMGRGTKTYIANGVASDVTPGFAYCGATYEESSYLAATANVNDSKLVFKPIFGLLEFKVGHPDVKSISVEMNDDAVPGRFDYDFANNTLTVNAYYARNFVINVDGPGTFYIPIVPDSSVNGIKFVIKDGTDNVLFESSTAKKVGTFSRGSVISMGMVDEHASMTYTGAYGSVINCSYNDKNQPFTANGRAYLGNVLWTVNSDSSYFGANDPFGQQFGSSNNPATLVTVTAGQFGDDVNRVIVKTSGAASTDAKFSVKVGGVAYKCNGAETVALTTSSTEYLFVPDGAAQKGEVELKWTQTAKKAIYLKAVGVNPNPVLVSTKTEDVSAIDATTATYNGSFEGYFVVDAAIAAGFTVGENTYSATALDKVEQKFYYNATGLTSGVEYKVKAWTSLDGGTTKVFGEEKAFTPKGVDTSIPILEEKFENNTWTTSGSDSSTKLTTADLPNFATLTNVYWARPTPGGVKLGTGSATGVMTTKALVLNKKAFKITVWAASYSATDGKLKITCGSQSKEYDLTNGGKDNKVVRECVLECDASNATCVTIETNKRGYINHILIKYND